MPSLRSWPLLLAACTSHRPPDETPPPPPPPPRTWLSQWEGDGFDEVLALAVAADGSTLAVGEGAGEMRVTVTGGDPMRVRAPAIELNRSGVVVKYAAGGGLAFVTAFEVVYVARGVAPTPDGGAIVVGSANSPVVEGSDGLPVRKHPDGFIARFDAAGRRQWLHRIAGEGWQEAVTVAAHPQGGYVLAGLFHGESRFQDDPAAPAFGATMAADDPEALGTIWDVFVARVGEAGEVMWIGELGGRGQDTVADVAVAADGTVALTGECRERTRVRGGSRSTTIDCNHLSVTAFLATWSAGGELGWAARVPGPKGDVQMPEGLSFTGDGEVVAVGMFSKGIGGGPLGTLRNPDPSFVDGFIVRYTAAGAPRWIRHLRGGGLERAWAVAPAGEDAAWVLADATADLELGDGTTYAPLVPRGGNNALLLRLDAAGAATHAELIGGKPAPAGAFPTVHDGDVSEVRAGCLAVAPGGDLRIGGSFSGALQAHPDAEFRLGSTSALDGFVLARPGSGGDSAEALAGRRPAP
jgi:hypothetical protein